MGSVDKLDWNKKIIELKLEAKKRSFPIFN